MSDSRKSSLDDLLSGTQIPGQVRQGGPPRRKKPDQKKPEGPDRPLLPEKHQRGVLMAAMAVVFGIGAWFWHSQPAPEGVASRSEDFPFADFKIVQPTAQAQVWFAEVNESFVYMSDRERKERCEQLIKPMPIGDVETLLLVDNSGINVTCLRPATAKQR